MFANGNRIGQPLQPLINNRKFFRTFDRTVAISSQQIRQINLRPDIFALNQNEHQFKQLRISFGQAAQKFQIRNICALFQNGFTRCSAGTLLFLLHKNDRQQHSGCRIIPLQYFGIRQNLSMLLAVQVKLLKQHLRRCFIQTFQRKVFAGKETVQSKIKSRMIQLIVRLAQTLRQFIRGNCLFK